MKTGKQVVLLEANTENIENTFAKIREFSDKNEYRIMGEMKLPTNLLGMKKSPHFDSKKQMKVVRNYINRLDKNVTMRVANTFLHFLFKRVYKSNTAPYVELSEKEIKIQSLRKEWKKASAEAEKLRVAYKTEKGDFYKKKLAK
jgi:ribosomal protein S10